jgi:pyruvate/2-oxoglutarate dehydrogenase complex dihydrolipoamide dehydrogenase (E3) component
MNYDVIVLGSGPAGYEAARRTAAAGRRTALVTVTPAGGRTTVGSLLPSKVWLHAAHHRASGASPMTPEETRATAERVQATIASRVQFTTEELREAGVEIISGTGAVTGPGRVTVTTEAEKLSLEASALVIATGSEPTFSPRVRPDGERIIAPRHTKMLTEIPESLVMVGGGITGVEYSEAFARLGTRVTLISSREILPAFHRPYAERLAEHLRSLGVTIETGHRVVSVERMDAGDGDGSLTDSRGVIRAITEEGREYFAEAAFIATGRAADLTLFDGGPDDAARGDGSDTSGGGDSGGGDSGGSDSGGSDTSGSDDGPSSGREMRARIADESGRFIAVDVAGRTALPGVYACGDATGPPFTANRALWQGRQVAAAILQDTGGAGRSSTAGISGASPRGTAVGISGASARDTTAPLDHTPALVEAVFTDPQLAQIGRAASADPATTTTTTPLREHRRSWSASMLDAVHRAEPGAAAGTPSSAAPGAAAEATSTAGPGELTVWTDEQGMIHRAVAFGEGAAEVLTSIQVAINSGITWEVLTRVPFGYPTLSEIVSS